jgi:hypothetical protein
MSHTERTLDPSAPLRTKPEFRPLPPATIEEMISDFQELAEGRSPKRTDEERQLDNAISLDMGTWLIESLSHGHHHQTTEPRMYGPFLSEALCVLSETSSTEPTVSLRLTLDPTDTLAALMLRDETTIDHAFNALVTAAHDIGMTVTITVTPPGATETLLIPFAPHKPLCPHPTEKSPDV